MRAFLYAPALRERLGDFTPAHDHAWDEARLAAWHPLHRSLCALKLRGGQDKWVLRQLAARLLARDVSRRPKHMFRAEPVIHAPGRPA